MEAFDKFGVELNIKLVTNFTYKKYSLIKFYFNNLVALKSKFGSISSYSDFFEDLLIESIAPKTVISYVDIGAGHPTIGSNSFYFYKKGYNGIIIEPIKFHTFLHKLIRKNDKIINALVGQPEAPQLFFEFNPTQYSTNSIEQLQKMRINGMEPRKSYWVPTINLNKILVDNDSIPFFISIDCEGNDYEILEAIDFRKLKNLFSIVFEKPNSTFVLAKVKELLELNGFVLRFETSNNLIYIHKI